VLRSESSEPTNGAFVIGRSNNGAGSDFQMREFPPNYFSLYPGDGARGVPSVVELPEYSERPPSPKQACSSADVVVGDVVVVGNEALENG